MLTFKNIQDHVLTFQDQAGNTGTGLDLVKLAIQSSHEQRLVADRWSFMLWKTPITLTFAAGVRNFILHYKTQFLTDFWNTTTDMLMKETPTRSRFKPGLIGDRHHYEFVQDSPVSAQPTEGVLTVTGSVRLEYINSAGAIVSEDITDAVSSGVVTEVLKVTKLTDSGVTTIADVSGVNILTLAVGEFGRSYPQIRLYGDGAQELGEYRFYRKPTVLSHDNDIPDIPYPFSRVLVFDALLELATYNDSAAPQFWLAQQAIWDKQLRQAYQEGEMEGSESRQIQEVDIYGG